MDNDEQNQNDIFVDTYKTIYDKVFAPLNRNRYLVNRDISLRNNSFKKSHRKFIFKRLLVLFSLALLGSASLTAVILIAVYGKGFSVPFFILFLLSLVFAVVDIQNVARYNQSKLKKYAYMRSNALQYEPEGIWDFDNFPDPGKRLRLIHAILGARTVERSLAESTTTAVNTEASDAMSAHLILSLADSKENDIDPYLVMKAEHFCEEIFRTQERLLPLMELHTFLVEEANKSKKTGAVED